MRRRSEFCSSFSDLCNFNFCSTLQTPPKGLTRKQEDKNSNVETGKKGRKDGRTEKDTEKGFPRDVLLPPNFSALAENFDVRGEGASIPSPEEQSLEHEFWTQETWKWLLPDRCKVLENQVLTSGKAPLLPLHPNSLPTFSCSQTERARVVRLSSSGTEHAKWGPYAW